MNFDDKMVIIIRTDGGLVRLEVLETRDVNLPQIKDLNIFLLLTALIILVVNTLVIR